MRLVSTYYKEFFPFDQMDCVTSLEFSNDFVDLKKDDILLVWGGEDISPYLYGKPSGFRTSAGDRPSRRDNIEWNMMKQAVQMDIPILGICRGAQMLCALAGGTLFQHVNNHGGYHIVTTPTGYEFQTNSLHHQMMRPEGTEHELIAWTKTNRVTHACEVEQSSPLPEIEPEFLYFPTVKGFAVQWHPEMMSADDPATAFVFEQVASRL